MKVGIFRKFGCVEIIGTLDTAARTGFIQLNGRTYVIQNVIGEQLIIVQDVTEFASNEEEAVETSCENGVTCPYCAFTHEADQFPLLKEEQLTVCVNCHSTIKVSAFVITTHYAAPVKRAAVADGKVIVHA